MRSFLLAIAVFGLVVPNGMFLHWLFTSYHGLAPVLQDELAMAFILDAVLALVVLALYFARFPLGRVGWPWFVLLSILGGLGFSIPFFWWLNTRGDRTASAG
jgi:hypothetical protein